jgi:hypothetical protein
MFDLVRKSVVVPQVSATAVLAVGTLASFAWLLTHDQIHPIFMYGLELFLAF